MSISTLRQHQQGFTIVELLIVIVIIAILTTISVVAYNGIQDRAADAAVANDIRNMGNQTMVYNIDNNTYPVGELALSGVGLKANRSGYGQHLVDGGTGFSYNLLYCSTITGYSPSLGAFVASSKSGRVFSFVNGTVSEVSRATWNEGWGTICPSVLNVTAGNSATGVWIYENSIWKSWLQ